MEHSKSLAPHTGKVFDAISRLECIKPFTLVGGTALSLQIEKRQSEDLDFMIWQKKLYVRADNHKIIAVMLTILSTVLGLIPFFIDGDEEAFWFSFSVGSAGGLLFSVIAIVFIMPIFMTMSSGFSKSG